MMQFYGNKGKNVTNFFTPIKHHEDQIHRHTEDRELNQARSKPDTADHVVAQRVLLIFLFLQTNITSQMQNSLSTVVVIFQYTTRMHIR